MGKSAKKTPQFNEFHTIPGAEKRHRMQKNGTAERSKTNKNTARIDGLSYTQICKALLTEHGIKVSKSTLSDWFANLNRAGDPEHGTEEHDEQAQPEKSDNSVKAYGSGTQRKATD